MAAFLRLEINAGFTRFFINEHVSSGFEDPAPTILKSIKKE